MIDVYDLSDSLGLKYAKIRPLNQLHMRLDLQQAWKLNTNLLRI